MILQRSFIALLLATFAVSGAQAQEGSGHSSGGSEFFFQSAAGVSDVTVGADYLNQSVELKGSGAEAEGSGFRLRAEYEYGLSEMFALGAQLAFVSGSEESGGTDEDVSGLEDPEIFLKGTSAMGAGRLRFGAILGLGLEDSKDDNVASGGFSLAPYVGFDFDAGPGVLGARLSYAFLMERTSEGPPETKTTGGNILGVAAFYEFMAADALLGAAIDFRSVGEIEIDDNEVADSGYSPLGARLYARIPVSSFVLLPSLAYDFSAGGDVYDKYNDMTLSIAARFGF